MDLYNIKNYISKRYKYLLYHEENNDSFILTIHGEFFVYGENKIGFNLISCEIAKQLDSDYWFLNGDNLYQGIVSLGRFKEYLSTIKQKQRIYKGGKRIKFWSNRLNHKILPYNTKLWDQA